MHILIVSHNYPFKLDYTFGFFCKNQADALVSVGQQVGVLCPLLYSIKYIFAQKKLLLGTKIGLNDGVNEFLFLLPSIPKLRKLRYLILKHLGQKMADSYIRKYGKPDVVHLHVFSAAETALYLKRKYGIPFIYTEHFTSVKNDEMSEAERQLLKRAAQEACRRISVGKEFKMSLEVKLNLPFDYVPNVYDSNIFNLMPRAQSRTKFEFIHVAHIHQRKNQTRLLEAFAQAFARRKNIYLTIIGFGTDQRAFLQKIRDLGLSQHVRLFGALAPREVSRNMQEADAFVLSSDYETFGVSIIEAMACGLPVVSTRCGGPESIITDNKVGVLTDKTASALSQGLLEVYSNYTRFDHKYIAQYAIEHFSFNAIGRKLLAFYRQCAS